jgi:hypothetical protein
MTSVLPEVQQSRDHDPGERGDDVIVANWLPG